MASPPAPTLAVVYRRLADAAPPSTPASAPVPGPSSTPPPSGPAPGISPPSPSTPPPASAPKPALTTSTPPPSPSPSPPEPAPSNPPGYSPPSPPEPAPSNPPGYSPGLGSSPPPQRPPPQLETAQSTLDQHKPSSSPTKIVATSVALTLAVCVVAAALLWLWQKRTKNSRNVIQNDSSESDGLHGNPDLERAGAGPRRYQYHELAAATSDFAEEEKLGQGGFGHVYLGRLAVAGGDNDHQEVAIKKFSMDSISQGRREFEAEVRIISQLRHRNLVQLHGWCDSRKGLLLVYELVPGGSLDRHIYNTNRLFTWPERNKIIMGLGSALRYLHQEWERCVLHGDIKPSNIMVDLSYNTKLGDFGLARLVDHGKAWQATRSVLGTAGYIDPEFVNTRRPSTESDVYSFGIVLLEVVCAKPPVVLHKDEPSFVLLKWVWSLYSQYAILDAADERLRGVVLHEKQMERVLVVGPWCAHPDLSERPSIARAMNVLQSDDARLPDLSRQMYRCKASPPPRDITVGGDYGGVTSSTSSGSGVPMSATTTTTRSSGFVS